MSVDISKELSPPNDAHEYHYNHRFVSVDRNKIISEYIPNWRISVAAAFGEEANIKSVIVDGVPVGPAPGPKAINGFVFITSKPYLQVKGFTDKESKHGPLKNERREDVDLTVKIGYKYCASNGAPWRAYPEVTNEQTGFLIGALNDALDGRPLVIRNATVTDAQGRPKSA